MQEHFGHGDCLMAVRYLPLLSAAGYSPLFKCTRPGLGPLLRCSFKDAPETNDREVLEGHPLPLRTYKIALMHLPAVFNGKSVPQKKRVNLHESVLHFPYGKVKPYVPAQPYLRADPERIAYYHRRIPSGAIGLVWRSGPGDLHTVKSMSLADLAPIWSRHPCVSLQLGPACKEIAGTSVLDALPAAPDWAETAALVMACRCVVCVDTGVAHLAGGLGAEVHLALHAEPQPYYAIRGVASPWYRHTRVYKKGAGWPDAVARIAAAL